jgi:hypothetical protein
MTITHVPLLQIQHDLHERPRNMARFYEYLRTIFGGDVSEENDTPHLVPLIAMNPMGRTHVNERLEQLLALGRRRLLLTPWRRRNNASPRALRNTQATISMVW